MFGNYKIKVNNESESKEVQEMFKQLGCGAVSVENNHESIQMWANGTLTSHSRHGDVAACFKEITLPQLRDMVVLHRNDVNDATHKHIGGGSAYKTVDDIAYLWTRMGWEYKGVAHNLLPLHKEHEQGLISGVDAKLAWAKGEELDFRNQKDKWYENWTNIYDKKNGFSIQEFDDTNYEFRLKPATIKIEIEIPKPFKPKFGDTAYFLSTNNSCGYTCTNDFKGYGFDSLIQFGAWQTEEQVKQVVEVLKNSIKGVENV